MSQRGVVHEENDMGDGRLTTTPTWRDRGWISQGYLNRVHRCGEIRIDTLDRNRDAGSAPQGDVGLSAQRPQGSVRVAGIPWWRPPGNLTGGTTVMRQRAGGVRRGSRVVVQV
jgi:hypothetical protein